MSTRRNVNLNKELSNEWCGRVRKWQKKWVTCAPPLELMKWVQTEERTTATGPRHPHIVPVKDLSLVPGARLGPPAEAPAAGAVADPTAAPPLIDLSHTQAAAPAAAAPDSNAAAGALEQQQQQYQQPVGTAAAAGGVPAQAGSAAAAAAAATPSSIVLDIPSASALEAAAGAAATGATSIGAAAGQPSPSAVTGGISYGQQVSGSQPPVLPVGLPSSSVMPAASDYTAGTDSEALGRLPHAGVTVSDYTAATDSMDVDIMMGQSQGTVSVQREGVDDDMGEDDEDDEVSGEEDGEEEEEDLDEDADDDDGLEDDEDDMPG